MAKVRVSGPARAYIRQEASYLRARSIPAAEAFLARLKEAQRNLSAFPELGRAAGGLPIPNTRRLVAGEYVIDYDFDGTEVFITSIRPAAIPEITIALDDTGDFEIPFPGPYNED